MTQALSESRPAAVVQTDAADQASYIAHVWYDRIFFIFSPLIALALGGILSLTPWAVQKYSLYNRPESAVSLFSGVFTMAHLVIVFFRSHGNPGILRRHPVRFWAAPVLLFGAMMLSSWVLVFVFVLAVWWDVYHSSLQTFGLGRLYDVRSGALSDKTRALDRGLNIVLYLGPVLGGAVMMDHVRHFDKFKEVGSAFFSVIPAWAGSHHGALTAVVLAAGAAYLVYYLWSYARLICEGHPVSRQKVILFVSTGICSVTAWGFNSFGQAFFIMNFFHALQYFALIWHAEKRTVRFWPVLVGAGFGYGVWAKFLGESSHAAMSLLLTVSILHFWYDGFIWSVRRSPAA